MTTQAISRQRRPRGRYPKTQDGAAPKRERRIPEYLEADEVNAIIRAAPSPKAKLLMLQQWRAGLRVSEALDLEVRDLSLDTATPTLRVRSGKGGKTRLVPVHPELHGALSSALAYGDISQGRLIEAHTTTAWRWVKTAVKRAEELGAISPGKRVSTHTLRHSYARHLLMNGIPINYLSRWLGHSSIQTTLIYLELVPDPTGSLAMVPSTTTQYSLMLRPVQSDVAKLPHSYSEPRGCRDGHYRRRHTSRAHAHQRRGQADEGEPRPEKLRHEPCGVHRGLAGW